jgi:hypothetical protein
MVAGGCVNALPPGREWDGDKRASRATLYRRYADAQEVQQGAPVAASPAGQSRPAGRSRLACPDCGRWLDQRPRPKADGRCWTCRRAVGTRRQRSKPRKRIETAVDFQDWQ